MAADSQQDQHVNIIFQTVTLKMYCFGHRKFQFFLLQAETICQQTSLFTAGEY